LQILFAILILALCPFLPETPRWLAKHDRVPEARTVLARLLDQPEDHPEVEAQLGEILTNIKMEDTGKEPSWTETFTNRSRTRNLQRVLIGMGRACLADTVCPS
jgi:hypothetical protein